MPPLRVTTQAAVSAFLEATLRDTHAKWPMVREDLRFMLAVSLAERPSLLEESQTRAYFTLARIAVEMQALRNLLPDDTGWRVTDTIVRNLVSDPTLGQHALAFITAFDSRWSAALGKGVNPTPMIGLTICEFLDLDETIEIDGEEQLNPVVLSGLSSIPILLGVGWWKKYCAVHSVE